MINVKIFDEYMERTKKELEELKSCVATLNRAIEIHKVKNEGLDEEVCNLMIKNSELESTISMLNNIIDKLKEIKY